jgi:hypothetical protein
MEIGVLDAGDGEAVECEFSPDGLRLIAIRIMSDREEEARVWDATPRPPHSVTTDR